MNNWGLILLGILCPVSTNPPQRHKGTEMFVYEPWSLFVGAFSGGVKGRALWSPGSRAGQAPLVPEKALRSPSRERERALEGGDGQQGEWMVSQGSVGHACPRSEGKQGYKLRPVPKCPNHFPSVPPNT